MAGIEYEVERLYGLPLGGFTSARNELAKRLAQEGDRVSAELVRALAKPPVSVWAINQAARSDKDGVRALLEAGEALRHAQAALLGQESGGEAMRSAQGKMREAVARLTESARHALEQTGKPAAQAQLDRIERTLKAAAVSEPARDDLRNGRLTGELEPAGFELLAALAPPAGPAGATGDELAERRRAKEVDQKQRKAARAQAREAERRARAAEREAAQAEKAAAEKRTAAQRARAAADQAAAALQDLS